MARVVWLTCALLSVAGARVFERCELARKLTELGVPPENLATWVCIAYHESRFDTNAKNRHSCDYGIFQISGLYWCGPGKACGMSCAALQDDDISNDVLCARVIHKEHTRLQGDGFLAWVVYPQHCKHNTKKYLVNCDLGAKNFAPSSKTRGFHNTNNYNDQPNITNDKQIIELLLPPYLTVGSYIRENFSKGFIEDSGKTNWYDYKIPNVDKLKLPVFVPPSQHLTMPPTTSAPRRATPAIVTEPRRTTTATTTTKYIPPVKVWRVIETNQFRKKQNFSDTSTQNTKTELPSEVERYTQSTKASTIRPVTIATPTLSPKLMSTTTLKPTTKAATTTTTNKVPTSTFTYRPSVSTTKPATSITMNRSLTATTTYRPISTALSTTQWFTRATTRKPTTAAVPRSVPTTRRPPTTTTQKSSTSTTTRKPTTTWTWSSTTSKKPTVTEKASTTKPKSDFSWSTFTTRTATTPVTTKLQPSAQTRTTEPFAFSTKTEGNAQARTAQAVTYSTTNKPQTTTQKPRTTQSVFDLYLNPTKAPQLPSYKYSWGQTKLKIFGGGTTPAPALPHAGCEEPSNDAA